MNGTCWRWRATAALPGPTAVAIFMSAVAAAATERCRNDDAPLRPRCRAAKCARGGGERATRRCAETAAAAVADREGADAELVLLKAPSGRLADAGEFRRDVKRRKARQEADWVTRRAVMYQHREGAAVEDARVSVSA